VADPSLTHSATGTSALATTTASFGFTATAGRLLCLIVGSDDYKTGDPTGYTLPTGGAQQTYLGHYFWYKIATGAETSVQYTIGSASKSAWIVLEFDNIDTIDVSNGQFTQSSDNEYVTPAVTPTTGRRFAIGSIGGSLDSDFAGMDAWLNGYTERGESSHSGSGTRDIVGAATLALDGNGSSTTSTGADYSGGRNPQSRTGIIVVFKVTAEAGGHPAVKRMGGVRFAHSLGQGKW
jgi:hypothetical protein